MVTLKELLALLDCTPVIVDMHPVSRCYLPSDIAVYRTAAELAWLLDCPADTLPERALILESDPYYARRFPRVRVADDPFTPALNDVIFEQFDKIAESMLIQSRLSKTIANQPDMPGQYAQLRQFDHDQPPGPEIERWRRL